MTIAKTFLSEFDTEMAATRKLLERIPADRLDWKPHEKSRTLGELATHVTEMPRWGLRFQGETFQVGSEKAPPMKTAAQFVARFDENTAAGRAGLAGKTDDQMRAEFKVLKPNGEVFFALPRRSLVRRVLLNHLIHHRGQLTVYLRQNDVPLPSIYGPTADEAV
ncbi:MAG TPA: DinB family protein [Thermoanaerobaculia bacterium]